MGNENQDWTHLELVTTWKDIEENLKRLAAYRGSHDKERDFLSQLIRRGTCFICCRVDGATFFAPSKFVGYAQDTILSYTPNKMAGNDTNEAISAILKSKPKPNKKLNEEYEKFCYSLGFTPPERGTFGVERKFWKTGREVR